ncbi:MAG: tetratricopeptide repeat protein [Candidatus Auribacterota bacterium]|jgi:tetratricopeptide (TPR) repeat protein|nr:tetratricopeptide repeat protein [Candidatus Auribacterota bacterium]
MTRATLKSYFAVALILFLGVIAYGNSLANKFAFDDYSVIEENELIGSMSNFSKLFSREYFSFSGEKSYRPLVTLTYMLDAAVWGKNAAGYHLTNLVMHLLSALVLFFLAVRIVKSKTAAFAASLIFVCHPLTTESVCSITFREDILCALFLWVALYCYIHYRQTDRPALTGLLLASYLFSLLSKEMGLAFIPIVIIFEIFNRKRPESLSVFVACAASIMVITGFFLLLRFNWMKNPDDFYTAPAFSVITLIKTLLLYWKLYILPVELNVVYYTAFMFYYWVQWVLLLIVAVLTVAGFIIMRPAERIQALFLLLLSLVAFVPTLNIYPIRHPIAERYAYLPAFGVMMVFGLAVVSIMRHVNRRWVFAGLIVCTAIFTGRTMARNAVWENNFTLWFETTARNPWAVEAHYSLGHAYQVRKDLPSAMTEYRRALKLDPNYFDARVNIGRAYIEINEPHKAIEEYLIALRINPDKAIVHYNLGVAYGKVDDHKKSVYHYIKAIELDPQYTQAYNSLGGFFAGIGDVERASSYWLQAVTVDPSFAQGFANLGSLYANAGDYQKAKFYWHKALQINPSYEKVRKDLETLEKSVQK